MSKTNFIQRAFVFIPFLWSCSSVSYTDVKEAVTGLWWIETLELNVNNDYYELIDCLGSYAISFKPSGKVVFPGIIDTTCIFFKKNSDTIEEGTWELNKREDEINNDIAPYSISIVSSSEIFNGHYELIFIFNETLRILMLELSSENFYLLAVKTPYDDNVSTNAMKKLEQATMGNVPEELVE